MSHNRESRYLGPFMPAVGSTLSRVFTGHSTGKSSLTEIPGQPSAYFFFYLVSVACWIAQRFFMLHGVNFGGVTESCCHQNRSTRALFALASSICNYLAFSNQLCLLRRTRSDRQVAVVPGTSTRPPLLVIPRTPLIQSKTCA